MNQEVKKKKKEKRNSTGKVTGTLSLYCWQS